MDPDFLIPADRQNPEQSCDNIERSLDYLMSSVFKLVQETDALQRLKNQLVIHAQQMDIDVQHLRDYQRNLRSILDQQRAGPVAPYPERPFSDPKSADLSSETTPLSLVDVDWNIITNSDTYKHQVNLRYALNMGSILCAIRFNKDGSLFAFADGRTAFIINAADGSLVGACQIPRSDSQNEESTRVIVFSPDSRLIALSGHGGSIVIVDVAEHAVLHVLTGHTKTVSALAFLSDSRTLISGSLDCTLRIWDTQEMKQTRLIQHGADGPRSEIMSLSVGPDDEFVAVGFVTGQVGIYEPTFSQPVMTFTAHSCLQSVTVSQSGLIGTTSRDQTAKVWLLRGTATCKQTLTGHSNIVLTIAFAPDQPIAFTGSKDETIKCWNHKTGENLFTLTGHKNTVLQIDHHPTAKTIVSCGGEGYVCVWDYNF